METFKPYMLINKAEQKLTLVRIDCSQQIAPGTYCLYTKNQWVEVFAVEGRFQNRPPSRGMDISASGVAAEYLTLLAAEIGDNQGSVSLRSKEGEIIDITFKKLYNYLHLHGNFMVNIKKEAVEMEFRIALPEGKEVIGYGVGYGVDVGDGKDCKFNIEEMSHSDRLALIRAVAEHKDLVLEQIIHNK